MNDLPIPTVRMSTYSVIPYQDINGLLRCLYLNAEGQLVPPDELDCAAQDGNVDFVCLQAMTAQVPSGIASDYALVTNATLFSAVVKTVGTHTCLPNTYLADSHQRLVLPVMPQTSRATILVFALASAANTGEIGGLIATGDPEIKNGSDGVDC